MAKRTKVVKPFTLKRGYELAPSILIGIKCSFKDFFVDWLVDKSIEQNLDPEKEESPYILLQKIAKLKDVELMMQLHIFWEGVYFKPDDCIVGVNIDHFDESKSLKRMKIEVYNALVKLEIMNSDDDLDWIELHTDMLVFDKKLFEGDEKIEKDK